MLFLNVHTIHGIKHTRGITSLVYVESRFFFLHVDSLLQHICLGMRNLVGSQVFFFCTQTNLNKWKWNSHSRCICQSGSFFLSLHFFAFFSLHFALSLCSSLLIRCDQCFISFFFLWWPVIASSLEDVWTVISYKMHLVANLRKIVAILCVDRSTNRFVLIGSLIFHSNSQNHMNKEMARQRGNDANYWMKKKK